MLRKTGGLALVGIVALVGGRAVSAQTRIVPTGRPDQNAPTATLRVDKGLSRDAFLPARNPQAPIQPFQVTSIDIEGSSLSPAALAPVFSTFTGRNIDNDDLSRITEAVSTLYAKSNIALYTILVPQQSFAGGKLKLIAVEGYVEGVAIRGHVNRQGQRFIARYFAPIQAEKPLRTSTLQRYVSLIRDIPGLNPSVDFERGSRQGAVRLVVKADAREVQVAASVNNRGTALLGRTQAEVDVFANSIVLGGDQVKATVAAPTDIGRFQYYGLAYSAPVDANGTTVQASAGYLRTRPAYIPLKGSATSFGLQVTHPFLRSLDRNFYATLSVDGINSDNALLGSTLSNDRSRALRVALSYALQGSKNSTTVSATVSQGIDGFGARTLTPEATDLGFTKVNAKILDNLIVTRNVVLRLDSFVQGSESRLPAAEQIALGGDEFGRAYEAAVVSGDYGTAGSAELAWRPAKRLPQILKGSEVYLFTDAGKVWSYGRNGFAGFSSTLASVGGGVRAQLAQRAVLQLEAALGLYNPVYYENREVWRLFFSVKTLF